MLHPGNCPAQIMGQSGDCKAAAQVSAPPFSFVWVA